jgi:hypothetical protein
MSTTLPPKGDADKKIGAHTAPLGVSAQDTPNMTVKVRAGSFFNGQNVFVEYAGGPSPTITVPVGNPKWVVVAITDAGTIALINGTPATAPSFPTIPPAHMPLASVFVTPTTVAITGSLIVDVRPFLRSLDVVPNLAGELANRPTIGDVSSNLALKADIDGTPSDTFTLNADFSAGTPVSDVWLQVLRGTEPTVAIRWNETINMWELTNDGVIYNPIASVTGTFAPVVHTHVSADVTNFASSVNSLIAVSPIAQAQVTNLVADLAAKASAATLTSHTSDGAIHFTLPIAQASVTGLPAALAGKASLTGAAFTGNVTVQGAGFQPITLASTDSGSSGLVVDRTGVPGPNARLEWDESTDAWLIGVTGNMDTVLTDAILANKVDTSTQVIAGTGLSGGGALTGNVTISMPSIGTPVSNLLQRITTDAQGRVTATSNVTAGDLPGHSHGVGAITGFDVAVDARIGLASIDALADVDTTTIPVANGQMLVRSGSLWVNTEFARFFEADTLTTDATPTTIVSIPLIAGQVRTVNVLANGIDTATGDVYASRMLATVKRVGAVTSMVGTQQEDLQNDVAAATWSLDVIANDTAETLEVIVTGEALKAIFWKVAVSAV